MKVRGSKRWGQNHEACRICMGQIWERHFLQTTCHNHSFSILQFQKMVHLLNFSPLCSRWNWGGTVSSSMALWLWVGTATDQLCLIIIFYHIASRITFSTCKTYQVQSTSEQEMLDSCCYSFSERETGWEEGNWVGGGNAPGSFTVSPSYFSLVSAC